MDQEDQEWFLHFADESSKRSKSISDRFGSIDDRFDGLDTSLIEIIGRLAYHTVKLSKVDERLDKI